MDIVEYIRCSDLGVNSNKIKLPEFNVIDKHLLNTYMETTRHFQEIYQLFNVYLYNFETIFNLYNTSSNLLRRNYIFDSAQNDHIIINSLIISYISSGKTLIDSIDSYIKRHLPNIIQEPNAKKFSSEIYDENFYYRFFNHLRNFAQHGHLPVTVVEASNHCYFNLHHFLYTPHFRHNAELKNELEKAIIDIEENYSLSPNVDFNVAVAEYNLCIFKIYSWFLNVVEPLIKQNKERIDALISRHKDIIYKAKNPLNGFIFYDFYDNRFHCFNPNEDPVICLSEIKSEVLEMLTSSQKNLEKIMDNIDCTCIYNFKS